jgi:hypothetical protein
MVIADFPGKMPMLVIHKRRYFDKGIHPAITRIKNIMATTPVRKTRLTEPG